MNKLVFCIGLITSAGMAGCATIARGTTQTVAINTPGAPGAVCTLISPSVGTQKIRSTPRSPIIKSYQPIIGSNWLHMRLSPIQLGVVHRDTGALAAMRLLPVKTGQPVEHHLSDWPNSPSIRL